MIFERFALCIMQMQAYSAKYAVQNDITHLCTPNKPDITIRFKIIPIKMVFRIFAVLTFRIQPSIAKYYCPKWYFACSWIVLSEYKLTREICNTHLCKQYKPNTTNPLK